MLLQEGRLCQKLKVFLGCLQFFQATMEDYRQKLNKDKTMKDSEPQGSTSKQRTLPFPTKLASAYIKKWKFLERWEEERSQNRTSGTYASDDSLEIMSPSWSPVATKHYLFFVIVIFNLSLLL